MFVTLAPLCKGLHSFLDKPQKAPPKAYQVSRRVRDAIASLKDDWTASDAESGERGDAGQPYLALVSDSDLLMQYLSACLREQYTVVEVDTPDELCARPDLDACQLVITDFSTNERHNFEMAVSMQPGECLGNVPVLMISQAIHWQVDPNSAFQPDRVLPMPVTPSTLREAVQRLITSGAVRQQQQRNRKST
ncbi:MAG: hypothetical protein AAGJ10_07285 [Bacteroidota bacterium]